MSAQCLVRVDDSGITVRVTFEKVTFTVSGKSVPMLKLSAPLQFTCKAFDISQLGGGWPQSVFVFHRVDLSSCDFDRFARNLLLDCAFLSGLNCAVPVVGARACVMVVCPDRPVLFVDTQGYRYARYVGRLG